MTYFPIHIKEQACLANLEDGFGNPVESGDGKAVCGEGYKFQARVDEA